MYFFLLCISEHKCLCQLVTAEYLCQLIKMLGSVFLSVNDMITEIRDQSNFAFIETEGQSAKRVCLQ